MKTCALLAFLPAASAFLAPLNLGTRGRAMRMVVDTTVVQPGAVVWLPNSPSYWDPLKLAKTPELFQQYQAQEIKHGRIAMLATADYLAHDILHWKLPGSLGDVPIETIPSGIKALNVVPYEGWIQIFVFASLLELLAPQKPDKVPGNVQPDSEIFPVPGDVVMRTREINNGRLAMIGAAGILVGQLLTDGQPPLDTFKDWLQTFG